MKKWKFNGKTKVNAFGVTLFQIEATADFGEVKIGTTGGWIEKEEALADNAWVYGDAEVYGNARVSGDAEVSGNARVYGNAWVYGNAEVSGNARVSGNADYICFQGFGSSNRTTTAFKIEGGGVGVKCGCFYGTVHEFETKVKETHGDSLYAKEYLAIAEVIKIHFGK